MYIHKYLINKMRVRTNLFSTSFLCRLTDNGQQCASMFAELDKSNPDIHEYVNRIQQATDNDRYFCMLNSYATITGRSAPTHLWRSNVKSDSPNYCYDANQLDQSEPEREIVRHFRR